MTHGCKAAGSGRATTFSPFHTPDRSGLPSGARGAGALRFGLPSAVRGMPGVLRSSHWASAGIVPTTRTSAARNNLIPPSDIVVGCCRRFGGW